MLKLAVLACGGMLLGPVQATSVQQLKDKITLTHARAPVAASTHSFPAEAVSSASSSSSLSSSSRLQAAVSEPIVNDELNASKKKLLVEEVRTEAVAEAQQEEMELLPHEADKVQDKASLVEAAVRGHTKGAHGAEAAHLSKNQMPFGMPFKYPQTLPEYDIALEYMEQVTMKQPPLWIKYHEVQLIYDQKSVDTQTQAIANLDFRPKPALNFVFAEDQAKMDAAFERAKQLCSDFSTEVKTFATLPQAEQTPAQTQTIAEMGKACTAAENTAKETKKTALERPQLMDQKHREQVNQRLLHAQEQLQYDQAALGKQKILITQQDQYHLKLVVERNQLAYSQNQPAWVVGTILTH